MVGLAVWAIDPTNCFGLLNGRIRDPGLSNGGLIFLLGVRA